MKSRCTAIGRGMGRMALGALVCLMGMVPAVRASAQEARTVHVSYDVPAGCPSESDFLDMVARDGGLLQARGRARRSFEVRVTGTAPVVGRVVVREGDGREGVRELDGPRCEDVVRAVAVVVALSIDAPLATPPEGVETPLPRPAPVDPAPESAEPLPPVPGIAAAIPEVGGAIDVRRRTSGRSAPRPGLARRLLGRMGDGREPRAEVQQRRRGLPRAPGRDSPGRSRSRFAPASSTRGPRDGATQVPGPEVRRPPRRMPLSRGGVATMVGRRLHPPALRAARGWSAPRRDHRPDRVGRRHATLARPGGAPALPMDVPAPVRGGGGRRLVSADPRAVLFRSRGVPISRSSLSLPSAGSVWGSSSRRRKSDDSDAGTP